MLCAGSGTSRQFKSVHAAAPLLFKKIERVEAMMCKRSAIPTSTVSDPVC